MKELSYLHNKPTVSGDIRSCEADFKVFEILPFEASGEGEHLLIHVRKTGCNTAYVARQLAQFFNVKDMLVSYAGMKDRFAVTEQWFSVHLPGQDASLDGFECEGVEILAHTRHNKKLKIGALSGNRFELVIRQVSDSAQLSERWQAIVESGVPNYFGEQRFGIDGNNLVRAEQMFAGKRVKDKKKRSMYLSAARSFIFNQVVNARIENDSFSTVQAGDVMMLAGSQSVFSPDEDLAAAQQRLEEKDIDVTAPMWGKGEVKTLGQVADLENSIAKESEAFCQGLIKFGLKQERRKIRLNVNNPEIELSSDKSVVTIAFDLPAGCFATSVLRELLDYQDLTVRRE